MLEILAELPEWLESGLTLIGELGAGIIEAIPDALLAIGELLAELGEAIMDIDWLQIGKDIINGLIKGIGEMGNALWKAAQNVAASALDGIKEFFGIASPSKVMRDQVGKFIPAGLAVGIEANTKPLTDAMHNLSTLTTDTVVADLNFNDAKFSTAAPAYSYGDTNVNIQVYANENQDVDELAEALMNRIQFAISRREVSVAL